MEPQVLVVALWGALSVFVAWVALATVSRRWLERRSVAQSVQSNVPDPTPEEILDAQALGLISRSEPSGPSQTN